MVGHAKGIFAQWRRDNLVSRLVILHVLPTLQLGGTEQQLLTVLRVARHGRFQHRVLCYRRRGALWQQFEDLGLHLDFFPIRLRRYPIDVWRLSQLMRACRAVVVHSYGEEAGLLARPAARVANVPVIVTAERSVGPYKSWFGHLLPWAERLLIHFTDLRIANSQAVRQHRLARDGTPPDRIVVLPNGVDLERFRNLDNGSVVAASQASEAGPVVGCVARLEPRKRIDVLLQAFSQVWRSLPDARLIVIGDGELRSNLEELAREFGIHQAVEFLGQRNDVPELLARMDIFVLASSHEGLSNAVLEAMAAGLPVVATNAPGICEVIHDDVTGRLVPVGDVDAIAAAVLDLSRFPEKRYRMGQAGRKLVEQEYSLSAAVRRLEELYVSLLQAKSVGVS